MEILFVFNEDNTNGGASSILRQVIDYYIAQNSVVHIVFRKNKKYGHFDDICCENLKLYYSKDLLHFIKNIWKVHKISFDYSFNSVVKFTGFVGVLKRLRLLHIKTMVGRESTSVFLRFKGLRLLYYKMWYQFGYKAVNVLICQSNIMKEQLIKNIPWIEKTARVVVIPNPVNLEKMNEMSMAVIDTSLYTPYIVTAGRMIPEKAYDVLLDAFSEINKEYSSLSLVILGDGMLRPQIENQIERLKIKDKVILAGQVSNVYPWFKQAKLCIVSSRMEGFPNVLLQMMSQNEKVVSTLCAGGIEKINGLFTCPINDSRALSHSILECLESDTMGRRSLFDEELNNRSIEKFIRIVEQSK